MLSDASADEENLAAVQEAISAQVFLKEMQLLGRRHPPGKTKLEQEDTRAALRAEIQKRFEDRVLEYKVRIVSVDWRNGVAKIRTSSPLPRHKESRRIPFQISFPYPLSIPMSREQAMAIDTRKPLSFSGRLKFESKRHGFIARPPSSQMLFVVRSKYYSSVTPICTFITDKYLIRIGDDELFTKQPELTELP